MAGNPNEKVRSAYDGLTRVLKNGLLDWTGIVRQLYERRDDPLHWKKPSMVFVNSMSDLFHEDLDRSFIADVFKTMIAADWHIFQVLTKRPERMSKNLNFFPWWKNHYEQNGRHIWIGASVENQDTADERIPWLIRTPAAVRFISAEPLLGPVDLTSLLSGRLDALAGDRKTSEGEIFAGGHGIDWVIVGGESGPNARPMRERWARDLVRDCKEAGVACFVKQMGTWWMKEMYGMNTKGSDQSWMPEELGIREWPKGFEHGQVS